MDLVKLGNSDLCVSRICMGCMGFGDPGRGQHSWTVDEEHSREIIKRDLELGVYYFLLLLQFPFYFLHFYYFSLYYFYSFYYFYFYLLYHYCY